MSGPLDGLKVIEMAGQGPVPFCAMVLADFEADIIRIDRPGRSVSIHDVTCRGRSTLSLDLRAEGVVDVVLEMVGRADVLLEGFRPGVMERLGLGPDICMAANSSLVYGRMTGWGQFGPLSQVAGHDINYIAISGALQAIGDADRPPVPPLNYVGDYAGGAMVLLSGLLAALYERQRSGLGQVLDVAMSDGAALMSAVMFGLKSSGEWRNERGANLLDGGAPFYSTYECSDGRFLAVGAIEPHFYRQLCERCGISDPLFEQQSEKAQWPELKRRLAALIRTHSREEWSVLFEGTDACVAPILDWDEAPQHAHNIARETFVMIEGVVQPAPAPRFSRTPAPVPKPHSTSPHDACKRWGLSASVLAAASRSGARGNAR